ncbi:MAG: DUF4837 family protein [Bacteroidales bacterium]|nr:DUF4837 family protein [Bacteroidales bacterium]
MKRTLTLIALGFALLLVAGGCDKKPKEQVLASISGKAGEVEIVSPKSVWESEAGNAIRTVLQAEYPYTPQKESKYRIYNVPPEGFVNIFRSHRNIVYLHIKDTCKTKLVISKDMWASPQTLITVYAPDEVSAARLILAQDELICETFEDAERERVIMNARKFENAGLAESVRSRFGGSPWFPSSYTLKKRTDDFYWISSETTYITQGIFIYSFPYTGKEQFTSEALVAKRNEVMKENVPGSLEGSYMITNPVITPGYKQRSYKGRDFTEIRSLWETQNDYMGGPFISDAFLSSDGKDVIVIEGFVYAPKYDKRDYLRQLEAIIYSWH